jgi:flagellin-like hook-associated protein FlgL
MAISDISLTAGMRRNLVELQNSVSLLDRTQTRLSSGKSVNTALDNAVNFFAAQGHNQRASDISSYKDSMAESVQTIKAANTGIEGITKLLESAKGLAESALSADKNTIEIDLSSVAAGQTIDIGATSTTVKVGNSDSETAQNLANAINTTDESGLKVLATVNGTTVTIKAEENTKTITTNAIVDDSAAGVSTSDVINKREELVEQYNSLMEQIDSMAGASGYRGVNLLKSDDTIMTVKFEGGTLDVNGFEATASAIGANDSATRFNSIEGMEWGINDNIEADIKALDDAVGTLRDEASKLSSNLSIITARQDFSTEMVNILQEGADSLTLADTNEEGANMLMLQTRQQLSTTALSMSAQAAQSVLRLF